MAAFEMAKMDMTLDDIIKAKKNSEKGFGKHNKAGGGNNPWGSKNFHNNSKAIFKPKFSHQNDFKAKFGRGGQGGPFKGPSPHRRDLVARNMAAGEPNVSNPVNYSCKLLVGNLAHTVSEADVIELFNEFGVLKSARLHHGTFEKAPQYVVCITFLCI